jgi:hypothetical protein
MITLLLQPTVALFVVDDKASFQNQVKTGRTPPCAGQPDRPVIVEPLQQRATI